MKNILISAVLTGIAVTAGIFLLQEYRKYEFRSFIADAEQARRDIDQALADTRESEYQRNTEEGMDCLGEQFYLDLIANNINSGSLVRSTALNKCGSVDRTVEIFVEPIMKESYGFELVDVEFPSPEWDRQNEWTASYIANGFEVSP